MHGRKKQKIENKFVHSIIDTNVVLRYLLKDNESLYQEAKKIFNNIIIGQEKIILTQIVFCEVIFVLTNFYNVSKEDIIDSLNNLLGYKGLIADKKVLFEALKIYKEHNLHIVDCILHAEAYINKYNLITFDKKLNQLKNTSKA